MSFSPRAAISVNLLHGAEDSQSTRAHHFSRATSPARMDSSAPGAVAPLSSLEDIHRRIDLINAERKLRGLPVRDYHNDRKALTRLMLRFEILSSEIRFLRSLEYAPPDAALTASAAATTIASASFASTSAAAAAAAVSTATPLGLRRVRKLKGEERLRARAESGGTQRHAQRGLLLCCGVSVAAVDAAREAVVRHGGGCGHC